MCGRFTLTSLDEQLADLFDVLEAPEPPTRFNIAPTHDITVVVRSDGEFSKYSKQSHGREAKLMRWGLIPNFADEISSFSTFNARAETVREKPTFQHAFERRRCLIPADGFFEWKEIGSYRQPFRFVKPDRSLFAFAGLWDCWKSPDGELLFSTTIVTTTPNSEVSEIHDRMPVILQQGDWAKWLAPDTTPEEAYGLLKPTADHFLEPYAVDVRVGKVSFQDPAAIEKAEVQGMLFS